MMEQCIGVDSNPSRTITGGYARISTEIDFDTREAVGEMQGSVDTRLLLLEKKMKRLESTLEQIHQKGGLHSIPSIDSNDPGSFVLTNNTVVMTNNPILEEPMMGNYQNYQNDQVANPETKIVKKRGGLEIQRSKNSPRAMLFQKMAERESDDGDREYREIQKNGRLLYAFDADIWAATMLILLKDIPNLKGGGNFWQAGPVLLCWFLNFGLQFAFLFWSFLYLAMPSARTIQDMYQSYHGEVFSKSGVLQIGRFETFASDNNLCGLAISKPHFLAAVLFIWSSACLKETVSTLRSWWIFTRLPQLPAGRPVDDFVVDVTKDMPRGKWSGERFVIVCASFRYKVAVYLVVLLPKLVISIALLLVGFVWLTASFHFSGMILNAVALTFVTTIDETLFDSYLPHHFREDILSRSKIALPKEKEEKDKGVLDNTVDPDDQSQREKSFVEKIMFHKYAQSYLPPLLVLISAIVSVIVWTVFAQTVLPGYLFDIQGPCNGYLAKTTTPWCPAFGHNCFPFGVLIEGS